MTHVESVSLDSALLVESSALAAPSPAERLQASREALQRWILVTYHPEDIKAARREQADGPRDPGWLGVLVDSINEVPMSKVAVRWLRRWWARHPLRATAEFAEVAAEELIGPVARKHPWLVLATAVGVGALATRVRPWRWVSRDAVIASLLPTVSVASILHWITSSLHRLHPGGDEAGTTPPTQAQAVKSQEQEQEQAPVAPQSAPRQGVAPLQAEPALH